MSFLACLLNLIPNRVQWERLMFVDSARLQDLKL